MTKKISLLLFVFAFAFYVAYACSAEECGSGKDKCCTTKAGKTYHCKAQSAGI